VEVVMAVAQEQLAKMEPQTQAAAVVGVVTG
jgi:hypothetical protein